jgi:UDP-N-acetylglucosamine diphosphorylase/glucosamine-1-phosphate N-acetyltransferase
MERKSQDFLPIILAGGLGKRMNSEIPKVLHHLCGKPMIIHIIEKVIKLNPKKIYIVVGKYKDIIKETVDYYSIGLSAETTTIINIEYVYQETAQGTGHAIMCCEESLKKESPNAKVLILSGDVPLIGENTINELINNKQKAVLLTTLLNDPFGYGRIKKKENVFERIVEQKDCDEEEKQIVEINGGVYCIENKYITEHISKLSNENKSNEYYLTDLLEIIKNNEDETIQTLELKREKQYEIMGVNTPEQLEELEKVYKVLEHSKKKVESSNRKKMRQLIWGMDR